MRFVWFWTFWHWSGEGFRAGKLLREPLQGLASHWDEWFRHEARPDECSAIESVGHDVSAQREFLEWLFNHWAPEADRTGNASVPHFALTQLCSVPPFDGWSAFARYREAYAVNGLRAIVLEEKSLGEPMDVRAIEAVALPAPRQSMTSAVVPEGFYSDAADLAAPRQAALNLLTGRALWRTVFKWIARGDRPYPRWLRGALALGWVSTALVILRLLVGPDPGDFLVFWYLGLLLLWLSLVGVALSTFAWEAYLAWRDGRALAGRLLQSEIRLQMKGGLRIKGGSAGLAYCFNILLSVSRAYPHLASRSWLWRKLFGRLNADASTWAATGIVTPEGRIQAVVLEPKLRACAQRSEIRHVLAPQQRQARRGVVSQLLATVPEISSSEIALASPLRTAPAGFAAEPPQLRVYPCRHVSGAMLRVSGLISGSQVAANLFGAGVSVAILAALPDIGAVLVPPPPPLVVSPASPTPYYLWVSLDTQSPRHFNVVLQSPFWTNRRVPVMKHGGPQGSIRAEIRLLRASASMGTTLTGGDGIVWIERRRRFLSREFDPGERVGEYSFWYLSHLDQ